MLGVLLLQGSIILLLVLLQAASLAPSSRPKLLIKLAARQGDRQAARDLERRTLWADLQVLRRMLSWALVLAYGFIGTMGLSWWQQLLSLGVLLIGVPMAARWKVSNRCAQRLLLAYEPKLAAIITPFRPLWKRLYTADYLYQAKRPLTAKEVNTLLRHPSLTDMSDVQRADMGRWLSLSRSTVRQRARSASELRTVLAGELLSPLLVDALHESGQVIFPVLAGDKAQTLVGFLSLHMARRVALQSRSPVVQQVMDEDIATIAPHSSLLEALQQMSKTDSTILRVESGESGELQFILLSDMIARSNR
jgi:hypothetical protein